MSRSSHSRPSGRARASGPRRSRNLARPEPAGTGEKLLAAISDQFHRDYGEPDQVLRLPAFRAACPEVIIGDAGFGVWQARIPELDGEQIISRYALRELLDKLDKLPRQTTFALFSNAVRSRAFWGTPLPSSTIQVV